MNMRIAIIFSALLGLALSLPSQTPTTTPAPVVKTPDLTNTEKLAIAQLQNEFSTLQQAQRKASQDLQDFEKEIETAHPGYIFDAAQGSLIPKPAPKPLPDTKKGK